MNFAEAETYLLSLGNEVAAMKLGLESVRTLLDNLGKPDRQYLKIQVAGTNGKGSVCAFLNSICIAARVRVGMYTSPHLVSIRERIQIDGKPVDEHEFAAVASFVREISELLVDRGEIESSPTFFEQVTAIALIVFANHGVDVAILETGLGGRLNATTATTAEISAITRIDLDHQEYLGETIEEIAAEKAAIIHAGSRVIVGEQRPEAMDIILRRCQEIGVEPFIDCESGKWAIDVPNRSVVAFFKTKRAIYDDPSLGLPGRHQLENARIAVMLSEALRYDYRLPIDVDSVVTGLEEARHAGRLELHDRYLFDGAHNLGGARALASYLEEFESRPMTLVFGAMDDKPVGEMLEALVPHADRIVLTQSANERSLDYDNLLTAMPNGVTKEKTFATDTVGKAIDIAETVTPENGIILVTGSLYLVGEVKRLTRRNRHEFEI